MVPFGKENLTRDITEIRICNNCSSKHRPSFGNYDIVYEGNTLKNAIQEYDRSGGALKLLSLAINKILGETK